MPHTLATIAQNVFLKILETHDNRQRPAAAPAPLVSDFFEIVPENPLHQLQARLERFLPRNFKAAGHMMEHALFLVQQDPANHKAMSVIGMGLNNISSISPDTSILTDITKAILASPNTIAIRTILTILKTTKNASIRLAIADGLKGTTNEQALTTLTRLVQTKNYTENYVAKITAGAHGLAGTTDTSALEAMRAKVGELLGQMDIRIFQPLTSALSHDETTIDLLAHKLERLELHDARVPPIAIALGKSDLPRAIAALKSNPQALKHLYPRVPDFFTVEDLATIENSDFYIQHAQRVVAARNRSAGDATDEISRAWILAQRGIHTNEITSRLIAILTSPAYSPTTTSDDGHLFRNYAALALKGNSAPRVKQAIKDTLKSVWHNAELVKDCLAFFEGTQDREDAQFLVDYLNLRLPIEAKIRVLQTLKSALHIKDQDDREFVKEAFVQHIGDEHQDYSIRKTATEILLGHDKPAARQAHALHALGSMAHRIFDGGQLQQIPSTNTGDSKAQLRDAGMDHRLVEIIGRFLPQQVRAAGDHLTTAFFGMGASILANGSSELAQKIQNNQEARTNALNIGLKILVSGTQELIRRSRGYEIIETQILTENRTAKIEVRTQDNRTRHISIDLNQPNTLLLHSPQGEQSHFSHNFALDSLLFSSVQATSIAGPMLTRGILR